MNDIKLTEHEVYLRERIRALEAAVAAELALRQTAEGYAARNALRVIELEAALHRYGRHNGLCGHYKCMCGLDDLLGISVARATAETKGEQG